MELRSSVWYRLQACGAGKAHVIDTDSRRTPRGENRVSMMILLLFVVAGIVAVVVFGVIFGRWRWAAESHTARAR